MIFKSFMENSFMNFFTKVMLNCAKSFCPEDEIKFLHSVLIYTLMDVLTVVDGLTDCLSIAGEFIINSSKETDIFLDVQMVIQVKIP